VNYSISTGVFILDNLFKIFMKIKILKMKSLQ